MRRTAALSVLALLVGATVVAGASDRAAQAGLSSGERPVLTPISPCRLTDTRPELLIGPRSGPLTAGETLAIAAVGTNGECTIPTDATALALNVTPVDATAATFLTFWPEGDRPNASSLNPAPGQPPTPNAVTTPLGADGAFRVFNLAGSVQLIVDIVGYYTDHDHDDRYDTSTEVDAKIADATAGIPGAGSSYTKAESDARYDTSEEVDTKIADATSGIPGAGSSYTKAEADARFHEGDDVVLVPADGTPVENAQALRDALAAISDAGPGNPHLVRLGAGVFDLGATPLAMLDHVSIEGSSTTSTVLRSAGLANTFTEDNATVMLADEVTLSDLTIENTGGASTAARALLGSGADFLVHDIRLVVVANGAQVAVAFEGADLSGSFDFSGTLRHVDAHVSAGTGAPSQAGGFGSSAFSGDMTSLLIADSTVELTTPGVGLGDLNGDCCSSVLEVRNTTVRLTAGGTGAGSTAFDRLIYDGVDIQVSGGSSTNVGFFDAGSGFRPQIRNSTIDVSGTGATGIRYNNGRPVVTNSTVRASAIGIDATSNSSFSGLATVENSVIDAPTAMRASTNGGEQRFRIGGTMLDATTFLQVASGAADARCTDVHTDDHDPVSADCSGIAASPLGGRTVLVPGDGTDSENGSALTAAVGQVASSSPSDGDEWVIRLEPGRYQLAAGVNLPAHTRIEGAGQHETEVVCTTCTVFTTSGSAPVTVADLTLRSNTTGFVTVFGTDVRLERVRVDAPQEFGDGVDITSGDARLVDVTITTNPISTISTSALESDVDTIVLDRTTIDGGRARWQHLGGEAEVSSSRVQQIIVGASSGTLRITDSTIDTRVASGSQPFGIADGSNTGTVTVEVRHSRIFTSSTRAIDLDTGPSTLVLEHVVIDRESSGFTPVDADTITMHHVTIDGPILSSVSETCLATARTDTGAFLPDTCP